MVFATDPGHSDELAPMHLQGLNNIPRIALLVARRSYGCSIVSGIMPVTMRKIGHQLPTTKHGKALTVRISFKCSVTVRMILQLMVIK